MQEAHMLAVYATHASPQDPLEALAVGDQPDPEVPDGWVRVRVRAASLNGHDLWTLKGVGIRAEQFPMILGCDGAGVTDDGREVVLHSVITSPGWVGDETMDPRRTLLTEKYPGAFAQYVAVPARNVLDKPAELSFNEVACLSTAWLTAYRMIFVKSGLRPGQTMLVQGSSGGVATALITLGAAGGLRVWATGRSEDKRAVATRLGAHATFESGARLPERVDGVFETVGKATWSHSLRSLKPGGVVVVSGATSGDATAAELQRIFFLQMRVVGSTMGTREEFADLLTFCRLHGISPAIGATLPLEDAAEGFRQMAAGETAGKIVLTLP
jgi:NADPH:quinone reductase-like Zn-dependent oxidoreductase